MPQCGLRSSVSSHRRVLQGLLAMYTGALLIFSQTRAFTWDESYHLLAAQLIRHGRKPYIDFCFPQTPLNAYANAGLIRVFGETWRAPHVFEALLMAGAVFLAAGYAYAHFPVAEWRFDAAILVVAAAGLNPKLFLYGTVAQPYGVALFALVLAFRVSPAAASREDPWMGALAGLFAGIAAASSLLTAAALPVFAIWILYFSDGGNRMMAGLLLAYSPSAADHASWGEQPTGGRQ